MCGIVGYVGKQKAAPFILEGLKRLEYRGYDSAGVAVLQDGAFHVVKKTGRVANLEQEVAKARLHGNYGIGHTRWATHGEPSDRNSHPHRSQDGNLAMVHNGIIENYMQLKQELVNKGHTFSSDTDTEVLVHFIGEIKNNPRIRIPIFGNGDVDSPEKAKEMKDRYGVDGIMIGRATIGYPWIFNEIKHFMRTGQHLPVPTIADRVAVCKEHLDFSMRWKSNHAGIVEMRRHYTNYFKGMPHFKEYRLKLVTTYSYEEIISILDEVEQKYAEAEIVPTNER